MKSILFSCLLFGLLLLSSAIHAEGNCPEGYYPIGAESGQSGPQGCAPIPGYNQQQGQQQTPQPPQPQWEDHWGAIATDIPNKSVGTATNLTSQSQATQAAIVDCQSKGGSACKVEIVYRNGCAALAAGDTGHNAKAGATVDAASEAAMKICRAADTHCEVYYSACSLPQRIQ